MSSGKKPKSIFSRVIDDLIRSAAGEKAKNIPDDDIDSYVANLISKEAKERQSRYKTEGIKAYQPNTGLPPNNLPKPNKRFLLNIVKATDSHNQAVIRAAEEKAREFQQRRREKEKEEDDDRHKGNKRSQHKQDNDDDYNKNDTRLLKRKRTNQDENTDSDSDSDNNSNSSNTTSDDSDNDTPISQQQRQQQQQQKESLRPSIETEPTIRHRGRGKLRNGSTMDKYFDKNYNPMNDIDSGSDIDDSINSSPSKGKRDKKDSIKSKKKKKDKERKKKKSKSDSRSKSKKHKHKHKHDR